MQVAIGSAGTPSPVISTTNTCWLFIADSAEARHLFDVIYATDVLKKRGVKLSDIFVFTDHPLATSHLSPFGIINVHGISAFATTTATLQTYDIAVTVVTGHGHPEGIGGPPTKHSPYGLAKAVRGIPKIAVGVIVLCQCYAGIFNYSDARSSPPLVVIGATNLNLSISADITLPVPIADSSGAAVLPGWSANLFMLMLFQWLASPSDVDGDGILSLMDAYKFAGTHSNAVMVGIKSNLFRAVEQASAHLKQLQAIPSTTKVALDAAEQQLNQRLQLLYVHQESWILNADQARAISFA